MAVAANKHCRVLFVMDLIVVVAAVVAAAVCSLLSIADCFFLLPIAY